MYISEVVAGGKVKFTIGQIAKLAGVSKRTIDYYTNLGLLNPVRSENNYRYYTEEALIRLKIIEGLKKNRFTLKEIQQQLSLLDGLKSEEVSKITGQEKLNIDCLRQQINQLEKQLAELQSMALNNTNQAIQLKNNIIVQSAVLLQSLLMYINEAIPYL